MEPLTIVIPPFRLELNDARLIVFLRGAKYAPHLTVYFRPNPGEPGDPVLTPHLSLPNGRKIWWGRLPVAALQRFAERFSEDLFLRWKEAAKRVELDQFDADGWVVFLPDDKGFIARLMRIFRTKPREYRFTHERIATFHDDMFRHLDEDHRSPLELAERDRARVYSAMRMTGDEELESCWIGYQPEGVLGPAGWYAIPFDWIDRDTRKDLVLEHGGAALREALSTIARALRIPRLSFESS